MPFIEARLSNKTVESIWAEATDSVVCNQSGCHNKATKVWDTPVKGSQVGYCDEHEGPATKAQPKTAGAKVYKTTGGESWAVRCDTNECRNLHHMEGLTHEGATQQAAAHNKIHHSKTAGFSPPKGATGFDPNGEWCSGTGETPLSSGGMNVAGGCPRCYEQNPTLSDSGTIKAHNPKKFHEASVDGPSEDSESFRPLNHDEIARLIRAEEDRRKADRGTPDRRQD